MELPFANFFFFKRCFINNAGEKQFTLNILSIFTSSTNFIRYLLLIPAELTTPSTIGNDSTRDSTLS